MQTDIRSPGVQGSADSSHEPAESPAEWPASAVRAAAAGLRPIPTGLETTGSLPGEPKAVLFDVYGTLLISSSGDIGSVENTGIEDGVPNARPDAPEAESGDAAFAAALAELPELAPAASAPLRARLASEARTLYLTTIRETHRRLKARGVANPEVEIRDTWRSVLRRIDPGGQLSSAEGAWGHLPDDLVARVALRYEICANPVALMPGAAELLALLQERGVPLGIVSNAQFFTPLVLEALFERPLEALGFRPELCAWSYQAGVAKPSPALFTPVLEELRRRYALQPREVLYIGNDVRNDIAPAAQLGMQTALFAGDRRALRLRAERLEDLPLKPDLVLAHWNDLRSMLLREKDLA